jgi:hypothetical protein
MLNEQNCSTCSLTYPICGRYKRVLIGFCRSPWKAQTNDNQQTRSDKK